VYEILPTQLYGESPQDGRVSKKLLCLKEIYGQSITFYHFNLGFTRKETLNSSR